MRLDSPGKISAIAIDGKLVELDFGAPPPREPKPLRVVKFATDAFIGSKLKVERAQKHIAELETALAAFSQSRPYSLPIFLDPETDEHVWRVSVDKTIPAEIGPIVGDIVHNLRSALDYIICDLVRANNLIAPLEDQKNPGRAGFPIAQTAKGNKSGQSGKIKGLSEKAQRLVSRLKHHRGWNDQAWRLHYMDVFDKHNLITTVGAATVQITVQTGITFMNLSASGELRIGGTPALGETPMLTAPGTPIGFKKIFPMEHDTEIHRSPAALYNDVQLIAEVAFGKGEIAAGEPVLTTVRQLANLVERTIKIFEIIA